MLKIIRQREKEKMTSDAGGVRVGDRKKIPKFTRRFKALRDSWKKSSLEISRTFSPPE
jgi:hypothetical protein